MPNELRPDVEHEAAHGLVPRDRPPQHVVEDPSDLLVELPATFRPVLKGALRVYDSQLWVMPVT